MITGMVKSNEARIRFNAIGPGRLEQEVEAVIDTGFTGSLTLPAAVIKDLGPRWRGIDSATLADGSTCVFDVYNGKVMWDGKPRRILVHEADADPLVGMKLLSGQELKILVRPRGKVTINPMRKTRSR